VLEDNFSVNIARRFCGVDAGAGVGAVACAPSSEGIRTGARRDSSLGGRGEGGRVGERVVVVSWERRPAKSKEERAAIVIAIALSV
jgi:hypothetical protein